MFCTKCGAQLNEGSAFCTRCGAGAAPVAAEVAEDISPKSRLAVSLLAWFLGYFGAHRFYAGKTETAVVMLMLTIISWVLMVSAFVAILGVISSVYWLVPSVAGMVLGGLLWASVSVWRIIDFIIALTGNFRDGQGKIIKKW